jgi:transposase
MNPATHGSEGSATVPVLYMALELSNRTWRLAFSDGAKRRQVAVPAADLIKLACAVAKAKERFGMPTSARVVSCYEAGRDGFWLHRHLLLGGVLMLRSYRRSPRYAWPSSKRAPTRRPALRH